MPTPDLAGTWMLKAPLSSDMQTTVTRTTTEVPNVLTAVVRSVASDGSFELVSVRFEVWGYQQVCVVASTMQVLAREGVTGPDLKRPTDGCVPARASRDRVAIANSLQLRQVP